MILSQNDQRTMGWLKSLKLNTEGLRHEDTPLIINTTVSLRSMVPEGLYVFY